jgi:hypothetical protein
VTTTDPGGVPVGTDVEALLRKLLFQSVMPEEDPANCGGCKAMVDYAAVVRRVSPPSAGADLCPWHGGFEDGRRSLRDDVMGVLR